MLINSLAAPFAPSKYSDNYRENIKSLIEERSKAKRLSNRRPWSIARP